MVTNQKRRVSRKLFSYVFDKTLFLNSKNLYLKVFSYFGANAVDKENIDKLGYNGLTSFAFVASKKDFSKAVARNKAKRRVRQIVFSLKGVLKEGYICLFFIKKGANEAQFSDIKDEMSLLMKKAGVLKE